MTHAPCSSRYSGSSAIRLIESESSTRFSTTSVDESPGKKIITCKHWPHFDNRSSKPADVPPDPPHHHRIFPLLLPASLKHRWFAALITFKFQRTVIHAGWQAKPYSPVFFTRLSSRYANLWNGDEIYRPLQPISRQVIKQRRRWVSPVHDRGARFQLCGLACSSSPDQTGYCHAALPSVCCFQ